MDGVRKTLYIPLYGKAYVSAKGLFIRDEKAEQIWNSEDFTLKGKSKSKWLAYYMGIRAAVFDRWVTQKLEADEDAVVVHIGCGLDSRVLRVGADERRWYDVDFPEVIEERKRYFTESGSYKMIAADVRETGWLEVISEKKSAVIVMEGISMYLTVEELRDLTQSLCGHFERAALLVDCYTTLAARLSKYKNPINDVGVTGVYGMDEPDVAQNGMLTFVSEHDMTPECFVDELKGTEKRIFHKLYAGGFSKKLYRLYEYKKA